MKYGLYTFKTGEVTCESSNALDIQVIHNKSCRVAHATTEEDYSYLGEGWQCNHCLHPLNCTSCNPDYREAVLKSCRSCGDNTTWHLHGDCLHCRYKALGV